MDIYTCVDYHGLNRLTVKNRYPLPLILGLLDQLSHAKVYTKIDLHGTYNLMSIREGDEWKMTFRTHYDHFEYVVMPFGLTNAPIVLQHMMNVFKIHYDHFEYVVMPFDLTNAPIVFQHMMNDVFCEYLDDIMVCYIDDILIFSKNMADHECHVCLILVKFQKVGFYAKLEKCGLHQFEVEFLGYIIFGDGIHMDLRKVQTTMDWATPASVQNV